MYVWYILLCMILTKRNWFHRTRSIPLHFVQNFSSWICWWKFIFLLSWHSSKKREGLCVCPARSYPIDKTVSSAEFKEDVEYIQPSSLMMMGCHNENFREYNRDASRCGATQPMKEIKESILFCFNGVICGTKCGRISGPDVHQLFIYLFISQWFYTTYWLFSSLNDIDPSYQHGQSRKLFYAQSTHRNVNHFSPHPSCHSTPHRLNGVEKEKKNQWFRQFVTLRIRKVLGSSRNGKSVPI